MGSCVCVGGGGDGANACMHVAAIESVGARTLHAVASVVCSPAFAAAAAVAAGPPAAAVVALMQPVGAPAALLLCLAGSACVVSQSQGGQVSPVCTSTFC